MSLMDTFEQDEQVSSQQLQSSGEKLQGTTKAHHLVLGLAMWSQTPQHTAGFVFPKRHPQETAGPGCSALSQAVLHSVVIT